MCTPRSSVNWSYMAFPRTFNLAISVPGIGSYPAWTIPVLALVGPPWLASAARSHTATFRRYLDNSRAVAQPTTPAPTITTSSICPRAGRSVICPCSCSGNAFTPVRVQPAPVLWCQDRRIGLTNLIQVSQFLLVLPYACSKSGKESSSAGSRLDTAGNRHRTTQDVALELHEETVAACTAIGSQSCDRGACLTLHNIDDVLDREGYALKRRTNYVGSGRSTSQPEDGPPGVHVPFRSAEAGEGRHDDNTTTVRDRTGKSLCFGGILDDAKSISQPLHSRSRDEHAPFQSVCHLAAQSPGDR